MGESTAVAHAVFIIVSVMMASVLGLIVLGKIGYMESLFSQSVQEKANAIGIRLLIINAYKNSTSNIIYVYVKNVGTVTFSDLPNIDLYMGNATGVLDYYRYNTSASSPGYYSITELGYVDNSWSPGETLRFNVYVQKQYSELIRVKLVLPNGVIAEDVVVIPQG